MEDVNGENNGKKRARYDSETDSAWSERVNSDDSVVDSPDVKRIRENLLDILDDSDAVVERDPAVQDLDSVIKSFEEEIVHHAPLEAEVVDLVSESNVAQPDLFYLLEASDDELGLPPAISPWEEETKKELMDFRGVLASEPVESCGVTAFEGKMTSYDSFEFGNVEGIVDEEHMDNEFVMLGGLFDHPEPFDLSEFPQPELSAL